MAQASDSREIRVFLSSTFRDFMAERDLLVKQVFPELRRKAKERGVEVVELDLRWGITEEESRQGKVLPICLAEIQRCRPYFVGMLGERYGWVPPADEDNRVVLADEAYAWVEEHLGRRSVTELEILHGVLNNPEMAGQAFFYFRDPAWSQAQSEPGFVCDSDEEAKRLADLKQRIRDSRFPVEEDLPDPKALADRIGEDLWDLIEEQFPELDQLDALEREERKHASYRRSRTQLYEDGGSGGGKVSQLEQWIATGEQRILITGKSGAGKSALIANWLQRHQQSHPDDVVFAHHLGCSNDANALEPVLARMVQTASKLMADELSDPIKLPQDYWELVSAVTDTLGMLSNWCKRQARRWIWVLDGLDRLPEENQQALPWLPLQLFPQLHVVISALDCQARTILQERDYTTLSVGPLELKEQKALIAATMRRYNKTLIPELEEKILKHQPARSPLFLRVVLDELRVCGRHETLAQQLDGYLKAQSVDALYAKVLERLEADVGRKPVQKVMQALWASRAGLSEPELQAITGVAPLQWAPIDLGLDGSFGRNGNRLVFDHDFLRFAVQDRYLPSEEQQRQAHSELADWYQDREGWDERDSEELPWQLQEAGRLEGLRDWLLKPWALANLEWDRGRRETINYWLAAKGEGDGELDELIADDLEEEIEKRREDAEDLIWFIDRIAELFDTAGLYRQPLLKLRALSLELEEASDDRSEETMLASLACLADAHRDLGDYDAALPLYQRCLEARERLLGLEHPSTLTTVNNLGLLHLSKGHYEQAEFFYKRALEARKRLLGPEHPNTLTSVNNLGTLYLHMGDYSKAANYFNLCLEARERVLGREHPKTLNSLSNLGCFYIDNGDYKRAESHIKRCLEAREKLLGADHPDTLNSVANLARLFQDNGDLERAEAMYKRCLLDRENLLGSEHPLTLNILNNLAGLYLRKGDFQQSEFYYMRCIEARGRRLGSTHPDTLTVIGNLGALCTAKGDYRLAEACYSRCLEAEEQLLGPEHPSTLISLCRLASLQSDKGDFQGATDLYKRCVETQERRLGRDHPDTLVTLNNLGLTYLAQGDHMQAGSCFARCLEARERLNGPEHPETLTIVNNLGSLCRRRGDCKEAETFYSRCLEAEERLLGPDHPSTLITIGNMGALYSEMGDHEQAVTYLRRCLVAQERVLGMEHPNTNATCWTLARILSGQDRHGEAIEVRRRELMWSRQQNGDTDPGTLTSINGLAIDLRETGELEEAEFLFRELVAARQQLLDPSDFDIGRALGGLAKTLDKAGKQEEAASFAKQALDHRFTHEGPDAWWTNSERLDLARVLHKLGRSAEAAQLLDQLNNSMDSLTAPDDADRQLIADAAALRRALEAGESR